MEIIEVGTHDGIFHTDEVFACAIIELMASLVNECYVKITRTRNKDILKNMTILLDVGGEYDPPKLKFDHHFSPVPKRETGEPYSSAGMVWKEYGDFIIRETPGLNGSEDEIHYVKKSIDEKIFIPIDLVDNGEGKPLPENIISLQNIVTIFNPFQKSNENPNENFQEVVNFFTKFLFRKIVSEMEIVKNEKFLKLFIDKSVSQSDRILKLEEPIPWKELLFKMERDKDFDFVIFQNQSGGWMIQSVPPELGSFEIKIPFPQSIQGKRGDELQKITGIETAVFCHPNGFIAGTESYNDAIKMASIALKKEI